MFLCDLVWCVWLGRVVGVPVARGGLRSMTEAVEDVLRLSNRRAVAFLMLCLRIFETVAAAVPPID